MGAVLAGNLRGIGGGYTQEQRPQGVAEDRSPLGLGKATGYGGSHRPAQRSLRPGTPSGEDLERAVDPVDGQDRGLHLWTMPQRPAREAAAPFGRPSHLNNCTSAVLGATGASPGPAMLPIPFEAAPNFPKPMRRPLFFRLPRMGRSRKSVCRIVHTRFSKLAQEGI